MWKFMYVFSYLQELIHFYRMGVIVGKHNANEAHPPRKYTVLHGGRPLTKRHTMRVAPNTRQ